MNDQDFERGLAEALQRASGELPENAHRYEQVRELRGRQAQRRRRVAGGLVAAAVVTVVGIGVLPVLQSGVEQATSGGANSEAALDSGGGDASKNQQVERPAVSCPDRPGRLGDPAPTDHVRLVPEGAISARLCGDGSYDDDVLNRNVGQLVTALNSLPGYDIGDCAGRHREPLDLVLGYPDGRQVVVTFDVDGCGLARSGERYRMAAGADGLDLVGLFESLLSKQKAND